MAESMTGKLIYKNRKRHLVFTTRKGRPWDNLINPDQLSRSLLANPHAEIEVVFELDRSGRPVRIRALDELKGDFHNPYNFIPALPRPKAGTDLDDRPAATHDRYHQDLWSGRIAVTLITQTPLLIPDAARATVGDKDHKTYPTRIDSEGRPYLPRTSIKGMLRSAYEAVTNSRMGVFAGHENPLAYREPAGKDSESRRPIHPARVEKKDGKLQFRIMPKDLGKPSSQSKLLKAYNDSSSKDKGAKQVAKQYKHGNGKLPEHGQPVWVKLSGDWVSDYLPGELDCPSNEWRFGWACIAGPNISNKRAERVFLKDDDTDKFIPIDGYEKLWRDLILNYQNEHRRELDTRRRKEQSPGDYLGDIPGKTAWSRHIDPGLEDGVLREGTLCYVELDPKNSHRITALFPVSISRRLYGASPADLLEPSVKPAEHEDNLSPADRVFGWASQEGKGTYRGNLRIGPATLPPPGSLTKFEGWGLPLAILSQPKPQQSRFYVARTKDKGEKQEDGLTKSEVAYVSTKGLRGRKVYPHHAGATAAEGYWAGPMEDRTQQGISSETGTYFQEYRRPHEGNPDNERIRLDKNSGATQFEIQPDKEQRDDQNRSISSWVEPGTMFNFEIDVTNLSDVELGALLWLLDLNAGQDGLPKLFHRLGGGKPLGFGSVLLKVNWDGTRLSRGSAWEEFYSSFDIEAPRRDMNDEGKNCIELFQGAVANTYREADFNQVSFIKAFLVCAEGFNAPVHYPRARPNTDRWAEGAALPPHPGGKAYEWFKTNEQVRDKKPQYAFSLPDLANRQGLPILDIDKEERGKKP